MLSERLYDSDMGHGRYFADEAFPFQALKNAQ